MPVNPQTLSQIEALADSLALDLLGGFHPDAAAKAPPSCKTLLLLGPSPTFWTEISNAPEMSDGQTDPIDRWSVRVISALADELGGTAAFPFGGPPYQPFYSWAMQTGRIWSSPVKLAVHDTHGLFVSFRGALLLPYRLDLPQTRATSPCDTCDKPCLTACPADALSANGYELDACHTYLDSPNGAECMTTGCAVRRACPVGKGKRHPDQSAYHMSVFHPSTQL